MKNWCLGDHKGRAGHSLARSDGEGESTAQAEEETGRAERHGHLGRADTEENSPPLLLPIFYPEMPAPWNPQIERNFRLGKNPDSNHSPLCTCLAAAENSAQP